MEFTALPASPRLFRTSDACGFSILVFLFRHLEETFMESATQTAPTSKTSLWVGRIISGLVVLFMLFNSVIGLMQPPMAVQGMIHLGYPVHLGTPIAVVMLVCTLIYAIPQTAFLGALLLTGYLGGATASHVRIGEPFFFPIVVGVLVWAGLFLRVDRLRALIPLRS
jgi:hypothetical protein